MKHIIKPKAFHKRKISYVRYLFSPLVLWMVFFSVVVLFTVDQRSREIDNMQARTELQASLMAEKIAGKLNSIEIVLHMIEQRGTPLELTTTQGQLQFVDFIRRQLIMYPDMDGICVLLPTGEKIYSTFFVDSPELLQMRMQIMDKHTAQGYSFSMTSFTYEDMRNLVLSKTVYDNSQNLSAVIMILVQSDRFFNEYDQVRSEGVASMALYNQNGDLHALWSSNDNDLQNSSQILQLQDLSGFDYSRVMQVEDTAILGGINTYSDGNSFFCSVQLTGYPMYLGILMDTNDALLSWDLSTRWNLLIIIGVIFISLVISVRLGHQTATNDSLKEELVSNLEDKVLERTNELHQAVAELERISEIDSLTGAYARRKLNSMLEAEINRANRSPVVFSIIIMDLDKFKIINDTFGHLVGDEVLKHVVTLLTERIAGTGILARWGGDELLVLLPGSGLEKALAVAESLRSAVQEYPYSSSIVVTLSMGVAQFSIGESVTGLIRRADNALYAAKAAGRNRVRS
jgi:diguanylate cyclase (GGDEF)-like protein